MQSKAEPKRQTVGSYKHGTVACIVGQGTPAYVFVITHILRFGEVDELSGNRILMLFNELSAFPVCIIVDRTTSVVGKIGIFLRDFMA